MPSIKCTWIKIRLPSKSCVTFSYSLFVFSSWFLKPFRLWPTPMLFLPHQFLPAICSEKCHFSVLYDLALLLDFAPFLLAFLFLLVLCCHQMMLYCCWVPMDTCSCCLPSQGICHCLFQLQRGTTYKAPQKATLQKFLYPSLAIWVRTHFPFSILSPPSITASSAHAYRYSSSLAHLLRKQESFSVGEASLSF